MLVSLFAKPISEEGIKVYEEPLRDGWWCRYDDTPGYDYGKPEIHFRQFPIKRETAKCVVIDEYGHDRFVLKKARKRYAYPTRELARQSFLIRKRKQRGYLASKHDHVVDVLKKAEELFA